MKIRGVPIPYICRLGWSESSCRMHTPHTLTRSSCHRSRQRQRRHCTSGQIRTRCLSVTNTGPRRPALCRSDPAQSAAAAGGAAAVAAAAAAAAAGGGVAVSGKGERGGWAAWSRAALLA
jgi:hypothetical protein